MSPGLIDAEQSSLQHTDCALYFNADFLTDLIGDAVPFAMSETFAGGLAGAPFIGTAFNPTGAGEGANFGTGAS